MNSEETLKIIEGYLNGGLDCETTIVAVNAILSVYKERER